MRIGRLTILLMALPVLVQASIRDALVEHWKRSADFTLAVANSMPAESYNFRPDPEEMSFGQLMRHIATVNLDACVNGSGMTRPKLPPKIVELAKDVVDVNVEKEAAIQFLNNSFDFCSTAIASISPKGMDTVVGPPASHLTSFEWFWSCFTAHGISPRRSGDLPAFEGYPTARIQVLEACGVRRD